jgi:hypothetical protein
MKKRCEFCGKWMDARLHGACFSCLRSSKRLGPALSALYEQFHMEHFHGKEARSVKNILNCANTLLFDGMWFAYKWNPLGNLKKVIETAVDRPYLTSAMVDELKQIIEGVSQDDKEDCQGRAGQSLS